jgi:hypothetical protein
MAALLLLSAAAVLIGIAILTDRGGITSAAVVIAGAISFFTGVFVLTFSGGETLDPRMVAILPVQGCINLCRMTADLGILGSASFLPEPFHHRNGVQQYNPVSRYDLRPVTGESTFQISGQGGVLVEPSCAPLLHDLRRRSGLQVPSDPPALDALFTGLGEDILECAASVRVERQKDTVLVTLSGYLFIEGCRAMAAESPRCCIVSPCPVCSLYGALLAESAQRPVEVQRCGPENDRTSVTVVFLIHQPDTPSPTGEGPDNSG